jgi:hypothetical protein
MGFLRHDKRNILGRHVFLNGIIRRGKLPAGRDSNSGRELLHMAAENTGMSRSGLPDITMVWKTNNIHQEPIKSLSSQVKSTVNDIDKGHLKHLYDKKQKEKW